MAVAITPAARRRLSDHVLFVTMCSSKRNLDHRERRTREVARRPSDYTHAAIVITLPVSIVPIYSLA